MPDTGSQPVRAATVRSTSELMSGGTEIRMRARLRRTRNANIADYRSFRPVRPRRLGPAWSASRQGQRGGIPEDFRIEERRHGAADALAHGDRHLRRDEGDLRELVAEHFLDLG